MTTTNPYPENTRQLAVRAESQAIGEFLDAGEYVLAEYREVDGHSEPQLVPVTKNIQQVLADWFEIDLDKVETEKQAMLAAMQEMNQ